MAQWFYAEGPGRNVGPLTAQEISDAFRRGILTLDTHLWRDGMSQWQPLRLVAGELGLQGMLSTPPPLPGSSPHVPPAPAYARPAQVRVAPASSGMSRGAIIAIICVAGGFFLLCILGILAAIALPAYSDYTARAKVAAAIGAGAELKPAIETHLISQGQCPSNDSPGFQAPDAYASQFVASMTVGEFDDGTCGVEIRTRGIRGGVDGHAIWLSMDPSTRQWTCTSELKDPQLPPHCRG